MINLPEEVFGDMQANGSVIHRSANWTHYIITKARAFDTGKPYTVYSMFDAPTGESGHVGYARVDGRLILVRWQWTDEGFVFLWA